MSSETPDSSNLHDIRAADTHMSSSLESAPDKSDAPSKFSPSGISNWAKTLKIPQPFVKSQDESSPGNTEKSTFLRFTSGLGMRSSPKSPQSDESADGASPTAQSGFIGTITKGLVDSSKSAVKAVQVKARHVVSQNKRRYQEGGFDLDMTYITENIIAMGFPAGDMSSGFFGYVEGFYRNHMEEVIRFFETYHKEKYKVYNLCSERLYDASLFEGKVASFPFDDHNCPPLQLITLFCQSAYSWLKEDIENVVVVHCKAGMARTGLMISSLLLYLKFFPTAEESIDYYNQKRCIDGKGLVLPSQIVSPILVSSQQVLPQHCFKLDTSYSFLKRYVKYFERILQYFNGENQSGRRCMLRGIRLLRCPYWIRPSISVSNHNGLLFSTKKHPRTKDLSPEDFWFSAPRKGVMVFALPGEPGLTELAGDFKIHFHDRQGDFYCWLNTTMVENRKILNTSDLDGFDKRKLPSAGFQVEVVLMDYDGTVVSPNPPSRTSATDTTENTGANSESKPDLGPVEEAKAAKGPKKEKDDELSDTESERSESSKPRQTDATVTVKDGISVENDSSQIANLTQKTEQLSLGNSAFSQTEQKDASVGEVSEFKAMAADASIFSFGDDEDDDIE